MVSPAPGRAHPRRTPGGAAHIRRSAGLALLGALSLCGCGADPAPPDAEALGLRLQDPFPAACPYRGDSPGVAIDTLATGLEVPWDVVFLDDGRALVTERPGRIRVISPDGRLQSELWARVPVLDDGEVGLMGIDVRTDADGNQQVYVGAVTNRGGEGLMRRIRGVGRRLVRLFDETKGQPQTFDVLRFSIDPVTGRAGPGEQILRLSPVGYLHGGGALRFGPDGLLYLTIGDGLHPEAARDPLSVLGKVLRFTPEGTPAALVEGDPLPIVLRGLRNPQRLEWHPETGALVLVDHGPSGLEAEGGRVGNDELNVVMPGSDLGWPVAAGGSEGGGVEGAVVEWTPSIAPAGLAVTSDAGGPWGLAAFVTGLADGRLRRLPFDRDDPSSVACEEPILDGGFGRLRLVAAAPDGSLWVGTSNRDGRGGPRDGDDLLLRLRPVASAPSS